MSTKRREAGYERCSSCDYPIDWTICDDGLRHDCSTKARRSYNTARAKSLERAGSNHRMDAVPYLTGAVSYNPFSVGKYQYYGLSTEGEFTRKENPKMYYDYDYSTKLPTIVAYKGKLSALDQDFIDKAKKIQDFIDKAKKIEEERDKLKGKCKGLEEERSRLVASLESKTQLHATKLKKASSVSELDKMEEAVWQVFDGAASNISGAEFALNLIRHIRLEKRAQKEEKERQED